MSNVKKITINKTIFFVQLASTMPEWAQGLSDVESMKKSQGLLFCYGQPMQRTFWMKGMKFPLDIILFDAGGKVIEVLQNLPKPEHKLVLDLPKYTSQFPIPFALEVNAGEADGIVFGDQLEIIRDMPK